MDRIPSPLDQLVTAVVGLGGPLTTIVTHMAASAEAGGRGAEAASPIPDALHAVLAEVLDGLRDDTPATDLEITARVLGRVGSACARRSCWSTRRGGPVARTLDDVVVVVR